LNEGAERITMRRVAAELDTGPASLYVYFRDTEELHTAVLEELLSTSTLLQAAEASQSAWRERLVTLLTGYTELLMRYPSVARVTAFSRPSGPHYLALINILLGLLIEGGVTPSVAAWGVDLLLQQAETTAVEQTIRLDTSGDNDELAAAINAATKQALPDLTYIAQLGDDLVSGEGPQRGAWAITVLINGLLATPRPNIDEAQPVPLPRSVHAPQR
jgi:AcrR family transcriptional regulator